LADFHFRAAFGRFVGRFNNIFNGLLSRRLFALNFNVDGRFLLLGCSRGRSQHTAERQRGASGP
jgi:hypothetical protein